MGNIEQNRCNENELKEAREKLILECEKSEASYKVFLDTFQGSSFLNKTKVHASILMGTLLENTTKSLKMYCTGLRPNILCGKEEGDGTGLEGYYWVQFKDFFKNRIKDSNFQNVEILIEKEDYLKNKPFGIISEALRDAGSEQKISIKVISEESKKYIDEFLNDSRYREKILMLKPDFSDGKRFHFNFTVCDDKSYRLEYDTEDYKAMASFDSKDWCLILGFLFDKAFKKAKDIKGDVKNLTTNGEKTEHVEDPTVCKQQPIVNDIN